MLRFSIFFICLTLTISCKKEVSIEERLPDWEAARGYYLDNMKASMAYLDSLESSGAGGKMAKRYFKLSRKAFKKAEPFASYLNPEVGHRVNGPALPIYKEDNGKILEPVGLQKIEESIYEGGVDDVTFKREVAITHGLMDVLVKDMRQRELTAARFFKATHQQLMRIMSLAISGFDTPVSHLGIEETIVSLNSLEEVYDTTFAFKVKESDQKLDEHFHAQISKAVGFINGNLDYDSFDRYTFIRDYFNPVMRDWVAIRQESGLWEDDHTMAFNFDAPTFFENGSFNLDFFTPSTNRNPTPQQIALGKKLFFDPRLSENGTMACATCHAPERAYSDGLVTNFSNTGKNLQRNTPTLINAAYQQAFFWDGRSENILDQISSVFTNKEEFNTNVHQFSDAILQDTTYLKSFDEAYGGITTKNTDVIKALSSYIFTLNSFDSKFDRNMRGESDDFSVEEKLGMNLFMGKALCATCHFIPLTSGTVPPFFQEHEREVIGVPKTAGNDTLDDDLGYYWKYGEGLHRGMFKTPTVRNAGATAPYMHNGAYKTLDAVMEFYNLGGGGGMGFDLPFQTLPFDELNLTQQEQQALVAFIETLTSEPGNEEVLASAKE